VASVQFLPEQLEGSVAAEHGVVDLVVQEDG
jgi:hypothetical protein